MYCALKNERDFENVAPGSFYIFRKEQDVVCMNSSEASIKDYMLVYGGPLFYDMSVKKIIENDDFSVSETDVIVIVYKGEPNCYYVELDGFSIADEFFDVFALDFGLEVAFSIADRFITFQSVADGYEYNIYDREYYRIDGGVYDGSYTMFFCVVDEVIRDLQKPVFDFSTGKFIRNATAGRMSKSKVFIPVDFCEILEKSIIALELEEENAEIERAFYKKTREMFVPIEGLCAKEIECIAIRHAFTVLSELEGEAGKTIRLVRCALSGSRCRGLESEDSDIDVVLEYRGNMQESCLFNLLNGENQIYIDGIPIDINPIRKEETGTLATYLPGVERYLAEKQTKGAL